MKARVWFVLWIGLGLSACTKPNSSAGTTTEAENTVAGIVVDSLGKPQANVYVNLIPEGFSLDFEVALTKTSAQELPFKTGQTRQVITGVDGKFLFEKVEDSVVSLDFRQEFNGDLVRVRLLRDLHVDSLPESNWQIALYPASTLRGMVTYIVGDEPLFKFSDHFRVGVDGMAKSASVISGREFVLSGVSPGRQTLLIYPADQFLVQQLVEAGMPLEALVHRVEQVFPADDTLYNLALTWQLPAGFSWSLEDTNLTVARRPVMQGRVFMKDSVPAAHCEVRVITDFFGLSYNSDGTESFPVSDSTVTWTDSLGWYTLPVWADSFNLEFLFWDQEGDSSYVSEVGMIKALGQKDLQDSINRIDSIFLRKASGINGTIKYTSEPDAWLQLGDHFKIGVKGTSRYVHVKLDSLFTLSGLPPGEQELVFYPGDPFVWNDFESQGFALDSMVQSVNILKLWEGSFIELQNVTYTLMPVPDSF